MFMAKVRASLKSRSQPENRRSLAPNDVKCAIATNTTLTLRRVKYACRENLKKFTMALFLLKPILWNTAGYMRPSGYKVSGAKAIRRNMAMVTRNGMPPRVLPSPRMANDTGPSIPSASAKHLPRKTVGKPSCS